MSKVKTKEKQFKITYCDYNAPFSKFAGLIKKMDQKVWDIESDVGKINILFKLSRETIDNMYFDEDTMDLVEEIESFRDKFRDRKERIHLLKERIRETKGQKEFLQNRLREKHERKDKLNKSMLLLGIQNVYGDEIDRIYENEESDEDNKIKDRLDLYKREWEDEIQKKKYKGVLDIFRKMHKLGEMEAELIWKKLDKKEKRIYIDVIEYKDRSYRDKCLELFDIDLDEYVNDEDESSDESLSDDDF